MRPQTETVSSQAAGSALVVDYAQNAFAVGFGVVVSAGGSLTYQVEHTFDNPMDSTVTPTWFVHPVVVGQTASKDGNYAFPIRGIRLNVTAYTSGSATLTVLQGRK